MAGLMTFQTDLQQSHSSPGPVARTLELQEEAGQAHELQAPSTAALAADLPWSTDPLALAGWWGHVSRGVDSGCSIWAVLCPHTLSFLPCPSPRSRVIPCSPEEIEVDGGELVLDEGPERPEEVRCLQTEQRVARHPPKPVPDPVYARDVVSLANTEPGCWRGHCGVSPTQVVRSPGSIWGLDSL